MAHRFVLGGGMSWQLEGSYFETCSCDVVCPCTASLALGATYDRWVTLVFHVHSGEVEGTEVSGLTVAGIVDTPKVMSEGNWRLGVFIDGAASDEQADKLGSVFAGELGGPMEALGPLVGENLGVERAPIEVREDGLRHSVRIGDAVDFEIEDVVPFGVETGEPAKLTGIFHPLLGADGRALRPRGDEPRVDGAHRGTDRVREDPSVGTRRDLGHRRRPARPRRRARDDTTHPPWTRRA